MPTLLMLDSSVLIDHGAMMRRLEDRALGDMKIPDAILRDMRRKLEDEMLYGKRNATRKEPS